MSLSESDYNDVGKSKSLELVGYAPVNVYTPATWRCLLCERIHTKTYRAVRYGKNGCICQSSRVNSRFRYESLGSGIGLIFVGTIKESPGSESVSGMATELGNNSSDLRTRTLPRTDDLTVGSDSRGGGDSVRTDLQLGESGIPIRIDSSTDERGGESLNNGIDSRTDDTGNRNTPAPIDQRRFSLRSGSGVPTSISMDTDKYIHRYDGGYDPTGIPQTTKELVVWARIDTPQEKFLASFQQLSYGNGVKLKKKLGIDNG